MKAIMQEEFDALKEERCIFTAIGLLLKRKENDAIVHKFCAWNASQVLDLFHGEPWQKEILNKKLDLIEILTKEDVKFDWVSFREIDSKIEDMRSSLTWSQSPIQADNIAIIFLKIGRIEESKAIIRSTQNNIFQHALKNKEFKKSAFLFPKKQISKLLSLVSEEYLAEKEKLKEGSAECIHKASMESVDFWDIY